VFLALQSHALPLFEKETSLGVPFGVLFVVIAVVVFIVRSLKPEDDSTGSAPPPRTYERDPALDEIRAYHDARRAERLASGRVNQPRRRKSQRLNPTVPLASTASPSTPSQRERTAQKFIELIKQVAGRTGKPPLEIAQRMLTHIDLPCVTEGQEILFTDDQCDLIQRDFSKLRRFCADVMEREGEYRENHAE
jgi:hypothetical protein